MHFFNNYLHVMRWDQEGPGIHCADGHRSSCCQPFSTPLNFGSSRTVVALVIHVPNDAIHAPSDVLGNFWAVEC
jgi:hypothetical protein